MVEMNNDGAALRDVERQFQQDKKLGVKSVFDMGIRLQSDLDTDPNPIDCSKPVTWHPWHGAIDYDSPEKYDSFFYQYGQKLLKYAAAAKRSGNVSTFSIGHELMSLAGTEPLNTEKAKGDYINFLSWEMKKDGASANGWAKTVVGDLIGFSKKLEERNGVQHPDPNPVDHRSWWQKDSDAVHAAIQGSDWREAPRKELEKWAKQNGDFTLSKDAKKYLFELENTRRAYLGGMWTQLIDKVKSSFGPNRPKITYDGGDDKSDAFNVGFLKDLDVISISHYRTLTKIAPGTYDTGVDDGRIPSIEDLKKGWMDSFDKMKKITEANPGKPVIFSELGFHGKEHSIMQPYLHWGCQTISKLQPDGSYKMVTEPSFKRGPSNEERVRAIKALRELVAAKQVPWLKGVAFWDSYTNPKAGGGDVYCVDCPRMVNCHPVDDSPYTDAIQDFFRDAGGVTNQYAAPDPCAIPKKVPPVLVVAKEPPHVVAEAEDPVPPLMVLPEFPQVKDLNLFEPKIPSAPPGAEAPTAVPDYGEGSDDYSSPDRSVRSP